MPLSNKLRCSFVFMRLADSWFLLNVLKDKLQGVYFDDVILRGVVGLLDDGCPVIPAPDFTPKS